MPRKPSRRYTLRSLPCLKATFKFVSSTEPSPYPVVAARIESSGAQALYNNLHETFSDFKAKTGRPQLLLLQSATESEKYSTIDLRVTNAFPRLLRLNLALCQLASLPVRTDLFINRGDITDLAMSFFTNPFNNYEKIRHVAYVTRGRLFVWHDKFREDTFPSVRARNNWYSGYKFEQVCAHEWPANHAEWGPLPKSETRPTPVLSLLQLSLEKDVQAMFLAEYDVADTNKTGLSRYIELKSFQPNQKKIEQIDWQTLPNDQVLKLLIDDRACMKFFKTCLQCKLAGCESVVYGIRTLEVGLAGVRKFQVTELESRLRQLKPGLYHGCYLKALRNVSELVRTLYQKCEENRFYLMTKKSAKAPLQVHAASDDEVLFPNPIAPELDTMLETTEKSRRIILQEYGRTFESVNKTEGKFSFIPGKAVVQSSEGAAEESVRNLLEKMQIE
ncbi:LAME_0F08746g1_1 [Lachancea meyersii CBS 8951]|uniref:Decapping nuclease n=1 Tax=Lachancea meyersii CBS 8951 TaxID=1266667 RepID=A0A1G4JUQ4_9SACH|nr:LAME_0F08746g1_1 [Lachancea meyersii CBS 8951]